MSLHKPPHHAGETALPTAAFAQIRYLEDIPSEIVDPFQNCIKIIKSTNFFETSYVVTVGHRSSLCVCWFSGVSNAALERVRVRSRSSFGLTF